MRTSGKHIKAAAILLFAILVFSAVPVSAASKPKLSGTKVTLYVGEKTALTLKNAPAAKVKWSSDNKSVAKVSGKGTVKAKKKGTGCIRASYKGKTYKCKVTVKEIKALEVGAGRKKTISLTSMLDSAGSLKIAKTYPKSATCLGTGKPGLIRKSGDLYRRFIFSKFKIGSHKYVVSDAYHYNKEHLPIGLMKVGGANHAAWYNDREAAKSGDGSKIYYGPNLGINVYTEALDISDIRKDFAKDVVITCDEYPVVSARPQDEGSSQPVIYVLRWKNYVSLSAFGMPDRTAFTLNVRYRNLSFSIPCIACQWKK